MESRTGSSFVVSLTALVVALTTFFARSAPQQTTVNAPATTTTAAGTTTTTTTGTTASVADGTTNPSPLVSAAAAVVEVMKAQTERAKADANVRTEHYKAVSARLKDERDHSRQWITTWVDSAYKVALLLVATVLVFVLQQRITSLTFFGVIFSLSPTPEPPLPANAKTAAAADSSAPRIALTHAVVRTLWRGRPRFLVRLTGDAAVLEHVRQVTYYLHPDYGEAQRIVNTTPFGLNIPAIGQFLLYADVKLSDETIVRLQRYLNA